MHTLKQQQHSLWLTLVRAGAYPTAMCLCLSVALHGIHAHWPLAINYLVPVAMMIGFLIPLERALPYCQQWRPTWFDNYRTDLALFMGNNLLFLAPVVVNFFILWFATIATRYPLLQVWPTHLSLVWQLILFLIVSELTQYWYHRLAHETYPLWRVHCVHHNPTRLYWLNGTRFHYVDIICIPILSNLPCVILGAQPDIVLFATVFSILHGFWQHANVDVEFGWLNYILAAPATHRWHHDKRMKIANHNYGSNLIIWDLVFKTFYLPKDELPPTDVGVKELSDSGIVRQFLMPLRMR